MSKTPILTKKQQKSSLSAKKAKRRETIRNVLASPYSKYWPVISNSHYQTLKNVLNEHLPKLLPEKLKIPWGELRTVPKSERKKLRKEYTSKQFGNDYLGQKTSEREGLILGINDVTRALENNKAKSVLLTEDVLPRIMVDHVIDQAVLSRTPILVVPELRTILKEKCGITSITVAFTDCPKYKLLQETIEELSEKYPVPENHVNFHRAQKLANDSVIIIEDSIIADISKANLKDTANPVEDKPGEETKGKNLEEYNVEPVKNVYLIRACKDKRVFTPEASYKESKKQIMDVDSSGFLSLSVDTPDEEKVEKTYVSLKVLKVKGDTNRNKRKIQAMKQRKNKRKGNKRFNKGETKNKLSNKLF